MTFMNVGRFYFATQRKLIIAFGSLFTNIEIARFSLNGNQGDILKTIKVPLGYGPAQKWLRLVREQVNPQGPTAKTRIKISAPRIAFELVDVQYDSQRKMISTNSNRGLHKNDDDISYVLRQLNPVPYNFTFRVSIITENKDDAFQIIEQILPNFVPSVNLPIKDIPELSADIVTDVPVIFNGMTKEDPYTGFGEDDRLITHELDFTVKAWLYPVLRDAKLIKKVIAKLYPDMDITKELPNTTITTFVDPMTAEQEDIYQIITEIENNEPEST